MGLDEIASNAYPAGSNQSSNNFLTGIFKSCVCASMTLIEGAALLYRLAKSFCEFGLRTDVVPTSSRFGASLPFLFAELLLNSGSDFPGRHAESLGEPKYCAQGRAFFGP